MEKSAYLLLVDDNRENLGVLSNILKEKGYKIALALDGNAALQVVKSISVDLILLDIMMPGIDGYEVCRQLKANPKYSDIPVIFLSALNDTADIVKAFQTGAVDYITKPFQADEVNVRVTTHLKLRQQNIELQKNNADKDRFISLLAHDLRNPLSALIGFSDLLIKNINKYSTEEIKSKVEIINDSGKSAHNLLEDILIWVKAQVGRVPFRPEFIDFSSMCDNVIEKVKLNAQTKHINISYFFDQNIKIFADANMLATILRNLLTNAIKFTNEGGKIQIYAESSENEIIITVSDNGVGMVPELIETIFDISQNQSKAGTAKEKGSGLGLHLCKEFVEQHGGRIWVNSKVGEGSEFKFSLPIN